MTAPRQFALVSLVIVLVGIGLVLWSGPKPDSRPRPVPTAPTPPPTPPPAEEPDAGVVVSPEGCATPTPLASVVCEFAQGTPLPISTGAAGAAVSDRFLYVVGGAADLNGSAGLNTVLYSVLDGQGRIGDWQKTTTYPLSIMQEGVAAHGGYVYAVGGAVPTPTDNLPQAAVYFAKVNADGSLGEWQKGPDLPEPVAAGGTVVLNDYLYVVGGYSTTGAETASSGIAWYSAFKPNGELAGWKKTTPLPGGRFFHAAAAGKSTIYVLGGTYRKEGYGAPYPDGSKPCESSRVLFSRQKLDGTLGPWTATTPFHENSLAGGAGVFGDTLFLLQSRSFKASHGSADILTAPIAKDGSVGAWSISGHMPNLAASRAVAVGPAGLYVAGGTTVRMEKPQLLTETSLVAVSGGKLACGR